MPLARTHARHADAVDLAIASCERAAGLSRRDGAAALETKATETALCRNLLHRGWSTGRADAAIAAFQTLATQPGELTPADQLLYSTANPENRRRYRSPAKLIPSAGGTFDPREVLSDFREAGARWERCLHGSDGLDLARVKVHSPALPLLRLPLGAVFGMQAAHERRHLLQAEGVFAALTRHG